MLSIEKVMEQSDIGYARQKMIFDSEGNPVDYRFLAVNPAFERLSGLKREEILNRRVTEIFPNIVDFDFDWIGYYGKILTEGGKGVFEQHSTSHDKWFRIEVFSCEKGCLTALFTDITHDRELAQASKEFLDDGQESNSYERIAQRMKTITGASYVVLNIFLEEGERFITPAIAGISSAFRKVVEMLGFNPLKKEWTPDTRRFELIRNNRVTTFDHLHEMTGSVISKSVVQLVEKTYNLGKVVIVKSNRGERMIGDFTLIFSKDNQLQNETEAVIYADMVAMLIENRKKSRKLIESAKQLRESKLQMDAIVSNIPVVIYTYRIDNQGNSILTFINENLTKILGFTPDDFIKNPPFFKNLLHPEDRFVWQEKLSGKDMTHEYRFKDKAGQYHWLLDKQKMLKKEADFVEMIGAWWDITENKDNQFETERLKEQYELAVSGSNDGIWDWNLSNDELFLSKRWKEMLGYEEQEIKNEYNSFVSLIYEEDLPKVDEFLQRYLNGEIEHYSLEFRMKHKDGSLVWILAKGEALRDENGKPYRMAGSQSNITERKEMEEKLRENQIRMELAMDTADHGFWEHNFETNEIYFSPGYFKMLGYQPDELPMRMETWFNLIHPEDRKIIVPQIDILVAKSQSYNKEIRMRCKDGSYKWVSGRGKIYCHDKSGKPYRMFGVLVDIDELKRKTEALKESHRMAKMGRWDYYHKQDDLQWSEGVFEIFEMDPEKFNANYQAFLERVHPDDREEVDQSWEISVKTHQPYDIEHRLLLKDGRIKWVKEYCYTEYDEHNNPQHSVGILQDITELTQERKKAEEASLAKSAFLANMNHELRTPLNGIIGFCDILRTTALDKQQSDYLDIVYTSGQHLAHIVTDILDFSRIEAGKFELNPEKTQLKNLVENTISMVRPKAEKKGLTLSGSIDHNIPQSIKVDASKLRQVLLNLISNAVKFTDEGSVHVSVCLQERKCGKARLLFKVTDNGMGIKEDEQMKIFDSFQQANMPASKKAEGTGLGLAISKKIVELMGGTLQLKSTYGKGSEFFFELLLACEQKQTTVMDKTESEKSDKQSLFKNKKILVAEDNPINMFYVQTVISMVSKEIQIIKAANGKEAYDLYREHQPDLILMDIRMPEVDGYQATAMIRSHDVQIPIIAVTAKALKGDNEASLPAGMTDYITKPISLESFKKTLKKYLL